LWDHTSSAAGCACVRRTCMPPDAARARPSAAWAHPAAAGRVRHRHGCATSPSVRWRPAAPHGRAAHAALALTLSALAPTLATGARAVQGEKVEYSLRLVPLGGYVAFPDDDPEGKAAFPPDDPDLLKNRSIAERALVISAGVLANAAFAMAILTTQARPARRARARAQAAAPAGGCCGHACARRTDGTRGGRRLSARVCVRLPCGQVRARGGRLRTCAAVRPAPARALALGLARPGADTCTAPRPPPPHALPAGRPGCAAASLRRLALQVTTVGVVESSFLPGVQARARSAPFPTLPRSPVYMRMLLQLGRDAAARGASLRSPAVPRMQKKSSAS